MKKDICRLLGFDYGKWVQMQHHNNTESSADFLLKTICQAIEIESKIKGKAMYKGYFTHIYYSSEIKSYVYFDAPVKSEIVELLIESGDVVGIGKKRHQGLRYEAWTAGVAKLARQHINEAGITYDPKENIIWNDKNESLSTTDLNSLYLDAIEKGIDINKTLFFNILKSIK